MIYLKSGRPGSGKTLSAIDQGLSWKAQGRKVYCMGINGLDYAKTGFEPYGESFEDWETRLQPGDCLIVDEVQDFLPKNMTRIVVPAWVNRLTRNRHAGIDLLFTTQDPKNVDSFVRRLFNMHQHYVNQWGKDQATVYTWPDGVDDPDARSEKERADKCTWSYPKELFALYTSAQLHTRKPTTPRKIKMLKLSLAICAICVLVAVVTMWSFRNRASAPQGAPPRVGSSSPTVGESPSLFTSAQSGQAHRVMTRGEWVSQMIPRVDGVIWSEPVFDGRKVQSEPETYCMSVDDGRCGCMSEQGTTVDMPVKMCREIALRGVYNPYKRPLQEHGYSEHRDVEQDARIVANRPPGWAPRLQMDTESLPETTMASSSGSGVHGVRPLSASYDTSVFGPHAAEQPAVPVAAPVVVTVPIVKGR